MQSVSSPHSLNSPTQVQETSVTHELTQTPSLDASPEWGRGASPRIRPVAQPLRSGVDSRKQAIAGLHDQSIAVLQGGCQLGLDMTQQRHDRHGEVNIAKAEEVLSVLATLQRTFEQQQGEQRSLVVNLTAQWEQRFASVLQCLKTTTTTAASMNERSAKFLRLGEVLEGALDQMSNDSKNVTLLFDKVNKIEANMGDLSHELADVKIEWQKMLHVVSRHTNDPMAMLHKCCEAECTNSNAISGSADMHEGSHRDVEHLSWELSEECAERRQLAREVQDNMLHTVTLRERLDATNEQLFRLSQELHARQGEVRQVVGGGSQSWNTEVSQDNALHVESCSEFSKQHDCVGLRVELAKRSIMATELEATTPLGSEREAAAPCGSARVPATPAVLAAAPVQGERSDDYVNFGNSPRMEPMPKDIANEIVAAIRAADMAQRDLASCREAR